MVTAYSIQRALLRERCCLSGSPFIYPIYGLGGLPEGGPPGSGKLPVPHSSWDLEFLAVFRLSSVCRCRKTHLG